VLCSRAEAAPRDVQGSRGEIDNGDRANAEVEQIVDERRRTAADVDHARAWAESCCDEQL
jgi:hypothetical protein